MANNIIKGAGDVYESDLYANLKKSGQAVLPVLEAINDILAKQSGSTSKIINIDAKDIQSIDKINKGIEDSNRLFEQRMANDKERIKVKRNIAKADKLEGRAIAELDLKIQKLNSSRNSLLKKQKEADKQRRIGNDEIADAIKLTTLEQTELANLSKELLLVKTERTQLNKENKALAQESLGLLDIYQRESKRLNNLRKEYKSLILIEGKATDETEKLRKEIDKLDKELKAADATVGQFQRNVGNYPDSANDATNANEDVGKSFKDMAKDAAIAFGVLAAGKASLDNLKDSIESNAEGAEELREVTAGLTGGLSQVKNVAASAALDIFDIGKGLFSGKTNALDFAKSLALTSVGLGQFDNSATAINKTFNRTDKATTNFTEKVKAAAAAEVEAERRTIAFENAIRPLEIQISKINRVIEEQNTIARDNTKSFNEIEIAAVKAQEAQVQRSKILINIAKEELDIIRIRLNARREAGDDVSDLLDKEKLAIIQLQDARTEASVQQLETDKVLRENARDRFERELDFAIDAFDAQKTVNERIVANDKESLLERSRVFAETLFLADKSFKNQIKLVQEFTGQKIDLDALASESDEESIRTSLKKFNFDDVTLGRVLEIIKERKLALQDLTDAQVDLSTVEQDAIDLRKDIISQEEALGKQTEENLSQSRQAIEDLSADRENAEIENLRRRLDLAKEGSVEALEIQKDLNDALLKQQEDRISEQEAAEQAAFENRKAIQKASLGLLEKASKASSDRRLKDIDRELSESEKVQDQLRNSAAKGVLDADKSLASEEKRQAELERQAQKEARQQELRTAGFKILSALLEQGKSPQEAIPQVGVLLGALPAVIDAIPTFYEGTNTTVADALGKPNLNTKRDGYVVRVDGSEKVLNPSQSARTGNMTTDQITSIAESYNSGMFNDLYNHNNVNDIVHDNNWNTNEAILSKFESLENTFVKSNQEIKKAINDKPVITDVTYKRILDELLITTQAKGKVIKTRSKTGNGRRTIFD